MDALLASRQSRHCFMIRETKLATRNYLGISVVVVVKMVVVVTAAPVESKWTTRDTCA